jgi:hypothetical protein
MKGRLDEGLDVRGVAAVQRKCIAVGQRPADPGCGEREGREMRDDLHLLEGDKLHQLAGYAIVQWIAGREHHRAAATQRPDAADDGGKGLRPQMPLGWGFWDESQHSLGADDDFSRADGETGTGRKALKAILAHSDDGQPLAHAAPRVSALMTAAAIAEPPLRPSSVA